MGTYAFSTPEKRQIREAAMAQGISQRELLRRADAAYPHEQMCMAQVEGQE